MIAGLLFMGGLRRSEVSALEWRDVADASDSDGVLITVRTSKTNQEGDTADVRYLKNGRSSESGPHHFAPTGPTTDALTRSGDRVVPATDSAPLHRRRLRRRHRGALDGAQWPGWARVRTDGQGRESTTEVMLAGNWKTARMVAHYSAGATAERGAVAKVSVGRGLLRSRGTPK